MVAVAGVSGSILWSTMMHFLMFYAFFHCICVGVAEFWGYPDRNLYGEYGHRQPDGCYRCLKEAFLWVFTNPILRSHVLQKTG